MLLKNLSGFNKFIRLNHIDDTTIEKAAEFLEIKKVSKGEYFIHEGEPSKFFAGLIKGKISFRKSKIINRETNERVLKHLYKFSLLRKPTIRRQDTKTFTNISSKNKNNDDEKEEENIPLQKIRSTLNINKIERKENVKFQQRFSISQNQPSIKSNLSLNNNKYSKKQEYKLIKENFDPQKYIVTEEELFQAGVGYCFGEWALIYNQPRSASIVTLEDSVFFILDEKFFTKTFLKCLKNSEHKKKKFVMENLFPFNILNERQSSIYKNIIPVACERGQIVFNEGEKADTLYIIYFGTFILEKKYKHKKFTVLSLEKGSIIGLESIFEGENSIYKCTLKLTSYEDLGLIFSCNVNKLVPYIINKMKESFKKDYLLFLKNSEDLYLNNIHIYQKMFFKRRNEKEEEQKEYIENNIKSKRYLSLREINENKKKLLLKNIKKYKDIKFKNSSQLKLDSIPFLQTMNSKNINKTKKLPIKRAKTGFKRNGSEESKLINIENKTKYSRKKLQKMNTYLNFHSNYKNKLNLNIIYDDNNIINGNEDNYEEKKYIEGYKVKKRNDKDSNINSKKSNKIINIMSMNEISNINRYSKAKSPNDDNKSSFITLQSFNKYSKFGKDLNNCKINNKILKYKFKEIKERIFSYKKNLGYNNCFYKTQNDNQISAKILLRKINEKCNLIFTPIKTKKYENNVQKYVKYLLSYKKEKDLQINKSPSQTEKTIKSNDKQKIKNIFKSYNSHYKIIKSRNMNNNEVNNHEYKTVNNSELSYSKTNLFTFNSGTFQLPLLSQIFMKNYFE